MPGQGAPKAACDEIAATFRVLRADTVEQASGRVENPLSHATEPGCRVEARGDVRRLPAPQLPEAVFLKSLDWETDSRYAADGDFSGNVAVRRGQALCFIDTEWNGEGDGSAPDLPDRAYRVTARCVFEPPPNRPSDGSPGRPAGSTEKVLAPARDRTLPHPPPPPRFTNVVAGEDFTCALAETRRVYCWGSRLANGSARDEEFPREVQGDHEFTAVAAGDAHVCALDLAGRAYCWGFGLTGALGGPTDSTAIPVPVTTPVRFLGLSAGPERTCAIDPDGSLYCWGRFSIPSTMPASTVGAPTTMANGARAPPAARQRSWHRSRSPRSGRSARRRPTAARWTRAALRTAGAATDSVSSALAAPVNRTSRRPRRPWSPMVTAGDLSVRGGRSRAA